jgi:hypothetical protein
MAGPGTGHPARGGTFTIGKMRGESLCGFPDENGGKRAGILYEIPEG